MESWHAHREASVRRLTQCASEPNASCRLPPIKHQNIEILPKSPLMPKPKEDENTESLKGWQPIATFLGQTVSVAERWAYQGMPVQRNGQVRTRLAGRIAPLVWAGISWRAGSDRE